jgi:hypothetical protein
VTHFSARWSLPPDVYTVSLGHCDVAWHVDRGIVAVACVGRDMIKVWPLPVETPWWEAQPVSGLKADDGTQLQWGHPHDSSGGYNDS